MAESLRQVFDELLSALVATPPAKLAAYAAGVASAINAYYALQARSNRLHWVWDNGQENRIKINLDDVWFPKDFLWGTATAAHQIEGNCTNNWSQWEHTKRADGSPRIRQGHSANVACDHWNRIDEDINLMKDLKVNAYRFSIEWSKIEPQIETWDQAVIDHYHTEIDKLLAAHITPFITLHHFTHPIWFHNLGAFEKEENIALFVRFAKRVFQEFGSKVKFWCTINEPEVITSGGYFTGEMPPGKQDWQLAAVVLKNLCEAHVQVYHALKALPGGTEAHIGIVKDIFQFEAANDWNPIERNVASMLNEVFNMSIINFFRTGHFRATIGHAYIYHYNEQAKYSNDFVGLNYYSHYQVRVNLLNLSNLFYFVHHERDIMTDMDYPIYPEGLYKALKTIATIGVPIYITENGIADAADDRRGFFIRRYLYAVSRAIREGVNVRGYFYWSLLDNFEWNAGYTMKFGLFDVDFDTQKRTLRPGAVFYKRIIQKHLAIQSE